MDDSTKIRFVHQNFFFNKNMKRKGVLMAYFSIVFDSFKEHSMIMIIQLPYIYYIDKDLRNITLNCQIVFGMTNLIFAVVVYWTLNKKMKYF